MSPNVFDLFDHHQTAHHSDDDQTDRKREDS